MSKPCKNVEIVRELIKESFNCFYVPCEKQMIEVIDIKGIKKLFIH
jgi:hypothetical protein